MLDDFIGDAEQKFNEKWRCDEKADMEKCIHEFVLRFSVNVAGVTDLRIKPCTGAVSVNYDLFCKHCNMPINELLKGCGCKSIKAE